MRFSVGLLAFLLSLFARCLPVLAGGGPENVAVVVNQNSDSSKAIANHYVEWRNIPACNVIYVDWRGDFNNCSATKFREQILQPVLDKINSRGLGLQVDYIAYSSDFPWRVDFSREFAEEGLPKQFRPLASLTGATYLWAYSLQSNPAMVIPDVNWYVPATSANNQMNCVRCAEVETRAFRSRYHWAKGGERSAKDKGQRFILCSMLGSTVPRGNTEEEILLYLSRAQAADATQPKGTFYFMKNRNVRSSTRHQCFEGVAAQMSLEGANVQILDGRMPARATDVVGLMTGAANLSIDDQAVNIQAGAFCEHLTSLGGNLAAHAQTKYSEFLRAGATSSSGTVVEPYAIQAKFPLPSVHLHYYRGASLAEAFYQSVASPYQILLVGDPLCQPWAVPPKVEIEGIEPGATVSGKVTVKVKVDPVPTAGERTCDLYVDGRLIVNRFPHVLPVPIDTAKLSPGPHELRVVSTKGELEIQGQSQLVFQVASESNESLTLEVQPRTVALSGKLRVDVSGPKNAKGIDILQNRRVVGHVGGPTGSVEIDAQVLGRGPVELTAELSQPSAAKSSNLRPQSSAPVSVRVK